MAMSNEKLSDAANIAIKILLVTAGLDMRNGRRETFYCVAASSGHFEVNCAH